LLAWRRKRRTPSYATKRAGIDRATISRLENGRIDNPTIATTTRYAKAMGKKIHVSLVEEGRESRLWRVDFERAIRGCEAAD
jgi:transcriptional regulator with XRE-family HTH domain